MAPSILQARRRTRRRCSRTRRCLCCSKRSPRWRSATDRRRCAHRPPPPSRCCACATSPMRHRTGGCAQRGSRCSCRRAARCCCKVPAAAARAPSCARWRGCTRACQAPASCRRLARCSNWISLILQNLAHRQSCLVKKNVSKRTCTDHDSLLASDCWLADMLSPAAALQTMYLPQRALSAPGATLWDQLSYGCSRPVGPSDVAATLQRVGLQHLLARVGGDWQRPTEWTGRTGPESQVTPSCHELHRNARAEFKTMLDC